MSYNGGSVAHCGEDVAKDLMAMAMARAPMMVSSDLMSGMVLPMPWHHPTDQDSQWQIHHSEDG